MSFKNSELQSSVMFELPFNMQRSQVPFPPPIGLTSLVMFYHHPMPSDRMLSRRAMESSHSPSRTRLVKLIAGASIWRIREKSQRDCQRSQLVREAQNSKEWFYQIHAEVIYTVILSLSDEDFAKLISGKANAQRLFMSGKLKLKGDMMFVLYLSNLMVFEDVLTGLQESSQDGANFEQGEGCKAQIVRVYVGRGCLYYISSFSIIKCFNPTRFPYSAYCSSCM